MHEMKTLTLNGETFDSFVDQTARQKADEAVRTVNGKNPDENGNIEIKVNAADAAEVAALVARAETAATDAEADAKSARTAATEANNAKGSAMQSASTASAKAILAQTHAGTATEKATAAEESATNASASATRAETAATSADAAASRATEAAERAENASSNSGGNANQGGLSSTATSLLIAILRNGLYSSDQSDNINALAIELSKTDTGDESPEIPEGATVYAVTYNLTNVTASNDVLYAAENSVYTTTLTAPDGYVFDSVTVTMGGKDITASAYIDGAVTIANVTGDIVITAVAEEYVEPETVVVFGAVSQAVLYSKTDRLCALLNVGEVPISTSYFTEETILYPHPVPAGASKVIVHCPGLYVGIALLNLSNGAYTQMVDSGWIYQDETTYEFASGTYGFATFNFKNGTANITNYDTTQITITFE